MSPECDTSNERLIRGGRYTIFVAECWNFPLEWKLLAHAKIGIRVLTTMMIDSSFLFSWLFFFFIVIRAFVTWSSGKIYELSPNASPSCRHDWQGSN